MASITKGVRQLSQTAICHHLVVVPTALLLPVGQTTRTALHPLLFTAVTKDMAVVPTREVQPKDQTSMVVHVIPCTMVAALMVKPLLLDLTMKAVAALLPCMVVVLMELLTHKDSIMKDVAAMAAHMAVVQMV